MMHGAIFPMQNQNINPHTGNYSITQQADSLEVNMILEAFFTMSSFWKGITLTRPCTEIFFAVSRDILCCKSSLIWDFGNWLIHHDTAPAYQFLLGIGVSNKNCIMVLPHPPFS
jgi:hypothetical protein